MDLRVNYPRSVKEKLGGFVHLARMIDKCRAALAGTLGEYIYPCPLDRRLLDFVGIAPEDFLQAVKDQPDEGIVRWFLAHATPHSPEEIEDWNRMMLSLGPDTAEKLVYFRSCVEKINPTRTDITTWADLLDLEEGRPVPIRQTAIAGGR